MRSMASSMPWATSPLTALRASGRLILMTANGATLLVVDRHGGHVSHVAVPSPTATARPVGDVTHARASWAPAVPLLRGLRGRAALPGLAAARLLRLRFVRRPVGRRPDDGRLPRAWRRARRRPAPSARAPPARIAEARLRSSAVLRRQPPGRRGCPSSGRRSRWAPAARAVGRGLVLVSAAPAAPSARWARPSGVALLRSACRALGRGLLLGAPTLLLGARGVAVRGDLEDVGDLGDAGGEAGDGGLARRRAARWGATSGSPCRAPGRRPARPGRRPSARRARRP